MPCYVIIVNERKNRGKQVSKSFFAFSSFTNNTYKILAGAKLPSGGRAENNDFAGYRALYIKQ